VDDPIIEFRKALFTRSTHTLQATIFAVLFNKPFLFSKSDASRYAKQAEEIRDKLAVSISEYNNIRYKIYISIDRASFLAIFNLFLVSPIESVGKRWSTYLSNFSSYRIISSTHYMRNCVQSYIQRYLQLLWFSRTKCTNGTRSQRDASGSSGKCIESPNKESPKKIQQEEVRDAV